MKQIFLVLIATIAFSRAMADAKRDPLSIIPMPQYVVEKEGYFTINRKTIIYFDAEAAAPLAAELAALLSKEVGHPLSVKQLENTPVRTGIVLRLVTDTLGKEGYRLNVAEKLVSATAEEANGLFYAIQTILQLLPTEPISDRGVRIPAVEIVDKPRFEWRGLMLDVGRYFYSVDYIKRFIDHLAMHKLNTFHFHLVEDHGWRIEIKQFPKLTDISAWRPSTNFQKGGEFIHEAPHGGYYTQEEIKEIVAYAQTKFVTVVPEIELPGHSLSALVAYPHLSCTGGPFSIPTEWAVQKDIYCAGNEEVFGFLEGVLDEVVALFPGEIIHIGGDEAIKGRWTACPKCNRRIADLGLNDEHELQSYFIDRIAKYLRSKGKRIIGWEEIIEGGLSPGALLMSWRGEYRGIDAARLGHEVVMTPREYVYFDYFQGEPYHEPTAFEHHLPLRKVYAFEPIPPSLEPQFHHLILGVQANLWTTYIHTFDRLEYMAFPRAAAIAEVAWSNKSQRNWEGFKRRLEKQYRRYLQAGINFSTSARQVYFDVSNLPDKGISLVRLSTDSYEPEIFYTLDGSEPTAESIRYDGPFEVAVRKTVLAATFKNGQRITPVSAYTVFHF